MKQFFKLFIAVIFGVVIGGGTVATLNGSLVLKTEAKVPQVESKLVEEDKFNNVVKSSEGKIEEDKKEEEAKETEDEEKQKVETKVQTKGKEKAKPMVAKEEVAVPKTERKNTEKKEQPKERPKQEEKKQVKETANKEVSKEEKEVPKQEAKTSNAANILINAGFAVAGNQYSYLTDLSGVVVQVTLNENGKVSKITFNGTTYYTWKYATKELLIAELGESEGSKEYKSLQKDMRKIEGAIKAAANAAGNSSLYSEILNGGASTNLYVKTF